MFCSPATPQAEVGLGSWCMHGGGSGHEQQAVLGGGREQWLKHSEDSGRPHAARSATEGLRAPPQLMSCQLFQITVLLRQFDPGWRVEPGSTVVSTNTSHLTSSGLPQQGVGISFPLTVVLSGCTEIWGTPLQPVVPHPEQKAAHAPDLHVLWFRSIP